MNIWRNTLHWTLVLVFLFVQNSIVRGQNTNLPNLDPLALENPFSDPKAVLNLQVYYTEKFGKPLSDDELLLFQRIRAIRYSFKLTDTCDLSSACGPAGGTSGEYVRLVRSIEIDMSDVDGAVQTAILAQQKNGCSKLKFSNIRRAVTAKSQIIYTAGVYAEKNTCYWFFGDQTTTLASGEGDVTVIVRTKVTSDDSDPKKGKVEYLPSHPSVNISDSDLLGFIDLETFLGGLIKGLLSIFDDLVSFLSFDVVNVGINKMLDQISSTDLALTSMFQTAQRLSDGVSYLGSEYKKFGEKFASSRIYWISEEHTGNQNPGGRLQLNVAFDAIALLSDYKKFVRPSIEMELKFIDSFKRDHQLVTLARGDNLYRVARNEYGTGEVFPYLVAINQLDDEDVVQIGQQISLPAVWKLDLHYSDMVRPGDTLWARFIKEHPVSEWDISKLKRLKGSPTIDRIFPFQRYSDVEQ